jgi:hypothetical protein
MERIKRKRLYPLLSAGMLAGGLILSEVMALAQVEQPLQQMPSPVGTMQPQPAPSLEKTPAQPAGAQEKKLAPPAGAQEKKLAPPAGAQEKKLAPRLNCGPGWRQVGEMSCEAVKPILQCPPGTNYFEGKFLVGCR